MTGVLRRAGANIRTMQGLREGNDQPNTDVVSQVFRIRHGAGAFTAGPDARYDYVRGAGSDANDCVVRVEVDPLYLKNADIIPPFALTSLGTSTNRDYVVNGLGNMRRYMPQTGVDGDIGLVTTWCQFHMSNQNAINEKMVRVHGLSTSAWKARYYKRSTRQIVPKIAVQPSYPVLGVTQPGWRVYDGNNSWGNTPNALQQSIWTEDGAHTPNPCYWAYVATGEMQFQDLMAEWAAFRGLAIAPGTRTRNLTWPNNYMDVGSWAGDADMRVGPGGPLFPGGGMLIDQGHPRVGAWGLREFVCAGAVMADDDPRRPYLRDVFESNMQAGNAIMAAQNAQLTANGLLYQRGAVSRNGVHTHEAQWGESYMSGMLCFASGVMPTAATAQFRGYYGRRWPGYASGCDIGNFVSYTLSQYDGDEVGISDPAFLHHNVGERLYFDPVTNRIQHLSDNGGVRNFTFTTDDSVSFFFKIPDIEGYKHNKRYWVVNVSGDTFQLSETKNGPPITIYSSEVRGYGSTTVETHVNSFCMNKKVLPARYFCSDVYIGPMRGAIAYHKRMGDDMGDLLTRFDVKVVANGINLNGAPQWNFVDN